MMDKDLSAQLNDWLCRLHVDYYDVFYQLFGLLFCRHPFTAEDLLVSKWWNAEILQICSSVTEDWLLIIMSIHFLYFIIILF